MGLELPVNSQWDTQLKQQLVSLTSQIPAIALEQDRFRVNPHRVCPQATIS